MKTIDWYFDFISPYAYLQFERHNRLPDDIAIRYQPVLFAGLLNHWEHKGPAEIPGKRQFTYRYTQWLADHIGVPMRMPPVHPFTPLPPLRLAIAMHSERAAIEEIFRFIWRDGNNPGDPEHWATIGERLGINDVDKRIADPQVKTTLRANTETALAHGVFGVPTFVIDEQLFWGFDATDMVIDYLANPELFATAEMQRISHLPQGASRL